MAIINKLNLYLKESIQELKNVTWPNKKEIKRHTILVIAISLAVAIFLGLIDYLLSLGIGKII